MQTRGEVSVSFLRASFSPKSYFPPVWFAEADDSHLTDDERAVYSTAPDANTKRGWQHEEEHFEKQREYAKRVYAKTEPVQQPVQEPNHLATKPVEVSPVDSSPASNLRIPLDPIREDLAAAASNLAEIQQIAADAITKAKHQRDEEEALLLLLL